MDFVFHIETHLDQINVFVLIKIHLRQKKMLLFRYRKIYDKLNCFCCILIKGLDIETVVFRFYIVDITVPEQVIQGQLALFNLPMRVWIKARICMYCVYSCYAVLIILSCDVYLLRFISA
jgi:hypothetical protein